MIPYVREICLSLLFSLGFGAAGQAASFDCDKAATETEKAICDDPELSALDELMGVLYHQSLRANDWYTTIEGSDQSLIQSQIKWLDQRDNLCGVNANCLYEIYLDRTIHFLEYTSRPQFSWDGYEEEYRRLEKCCARADKYIEDEVVELLAFLPFLVQETDIRHFSTSYNVFWNDAKLNSLSFLFTSRDNPNYIYSDSKGIFNENTTKLLISVEDRNGERTYSDLFELQPLLFETEVSIWDKGFKIHTYFPKGQRSDTYEILNLNSAPKLIESEGY